MDKARAWYSKAVSGNVKVFGEDHFKCQALRDNLAALERTKNDNHVAGETVIVNEQAYSEVAADASRPESESASRRHRVLKKLGWKRA